MERKVLYTEDLKYYVRTFEVDDENAYLVFKYEKHIIDIIQRLHEVYSCNKGCFEITCEEQKEIVLDIAGKYHTFISIEDSPSVFGNVYHKIEELKEFGILDDNNTIEICEAFLSPALEKENEIIAFRWELCDSDWYIANIKDYVKDEYKGDFIRIIPFYKLLSGNSFSTKQCFHVLCDILDSVKKDEKKRTYIFKDTTGYYMIGHTKNVPQRYGNVRVGNTTLELVCHLDGDYVKQLYKDFAHKKVEGIWFNLTQDDIESIKKYH